MAAMKLLSAATLAIGLIAVNAVDAADVNYHLVKTIPVGGDGGWDYLSVDSAAQRLYVSHGTEVVVIDLAKDTVAGEITNTPGVHGLAVAPELGRGLVTCGRENKAALVDLKTLEILAKVDTGANPDGMLYEPGRREFYTFNGRGQSATVIDARTQKVVATIPLGGKPEFAQADAKAGLVFDNLEDQSEVAVIDTKTHSVTNRWPIAPGEEASGMALDEKNHRLFLGCGNQRMVMLDSTSGKVLASVPIGGGVDANAFDPATQLAFASCGDGTVTIAHEEGDTLTVVQTLPTEKGARTMTIDPATHKIYLASAKFDAPAAGQRRGKMVAGSFKILIYGMDK
jgi:YVTN family beta-propeller protein